MQRKAKANHHKTKIQEGRQNPKQFWKAVKDVFPTKPGSDNKPSSVTHNKKLADNFRNYYSTAVSTLKSNCMRLKNFVWKSPVIEFSVERITTGNAKGLPCEFIVDPLHHIVNLSLQTSTVPAAWKQAKIVPIFKSGDQKQAENYRPISVLPILSKLLEKAVHSQLLTYLEENKLLNDSQYGYRAKRSTQLATTLYNPLRRQYQGSSGKWRIGRCFVLRLEQGIRYYQSRHHSQQTSKLRSKVS